MIRHIKLLLSEEDYNKFKEARDKTKSKSWEKYFLSLIENKKEGGNKD